MKSKKLEECYTIIETAIDQFNSVGVLLLFSGGHDSMVSTHIASNICNELGVDFVVYHGDTTICIKETRDYVVNQCEKYGWRLEIRSPKKNETYREIVQEYGFPGSNPTAHGIMYRRLKERALRKFITHEIKSKPKARENVLLISGARRSESVIRMGYKDAIKKDGSKIWVAPCFNFQSNDIDNYMNENNISRNPVKDLIGISGECLCGCFADKGEFDLISQHFPKTADYIEELHELAVKNGKEWFWTQCPNDWSKMYPEGQISLDLGMCSNCSRILVEN